MPSGSGSSKFCVTVRLVAPWLNLVSTCCPAGEVLFGTDSHTCNAGAFGQFASGVGNTDAGFILGTGKLLIKVRKALNSMRNFNHNSASLPAVSATSTPASSPASCSRCID